MPVTDGTEDKIRNGKLGCVYGSVRGCGKTGGPSRQSRSGNSRAVKPATRPREEVDGNNLPSSFSPLGVETKAEEEA